MYQIEMKAALVAHYLHPDAGWTVTVDIDPMERGCGGQHPTDKRDRALKAEALLRALGANIGAHPTFGRVDLVGVHPQHGVLVLEVEGESSRQREQALYSALGQTILAMRTFDAGISYGIAVPDQDAWIRQVAKLPAVVAHRLQLRVLAVRPDAVREVELSMTSEA